MKVIFKNPVKILGVKYNKGEVHTLPKELEQNWYVLAMITNKTCIVQSEEAAKPLSDDKHIRHEELKAKAQAKAAKKSGDPKPEAPKKPKKAAKETAPPSEG